LSAGPQPAAQRVAPHLVAFGLQLGPQAAGTVPPSTVGKRLLRSGLPTGNGRRVDRLPLVLAAAAVPSTRYRSVSARVLDCVLINTYLLTVELLEPASKAGTGHHFFKCRARFPHASAPRCWAWPAPRQRAASGPVGRARCFEHGPHRLLGSGGHLAHALGFKGGRVFFAGDGRAVN
jgi:hypothetical protein